MTTRQQLALLVAAVAIAFLPVLDNGFVSLDDGHLITENVIVRQISWASIVQSFTTFDPELYIPLTLLSYQLEYFIGQGSAWVFHAVSLLLHLGSVLLIFAILRLHYRNTGLALGCALLFGVHPLNTEIVAWASARKDILSTVLQLASLYFFLRAEETEEQHWYRLSLVSFLLGLLAKVSVLTLPVILLLLPIPETATLKHRLRRLIPFFAGSLALGIVALLPKAHNIASLSPLQTLLLLSKSFVFSLMHVALPWGYSPIYPQSDAVSFSQPEFFGSVSLATLALICCLMLCRHRTIWRLPCGLIFVTFIPTAVTFSKNGLLFFASDRYAYLPALGLIIMAGLTVTALQSLLPSSIRRQQWQNRLLLVLTICLIVLSYRQSRIWQSSESLYLHALSQSPNSILALNNLGDTLMKQQRFDEARLLFERAVNIAPRFIAALINLGGWHEDRGEIDVAEQFYRQAVDVLPTETIINPERIAAYFFLARVLEKKGRIAEAIDLYEQARNRAPQFADTHFNAGLMYQKHQQTQEAVAAFRQAVEMEPLFLDARYHLAGALAEEGKLAQARQELVSLLSYDPSYKKARQHLQAINALLLKQAP